MGESALAIAGAVDDPIPRLASLARTRLRAPPPRRRRPGHRGARGSTGDHPHPAHPALLHRGGRVPGRGAYAGGPGRGSPAAPHRSPGAGTGKPGPHARLPRRSLARLGPGGGRAPRGRGGARLRPGRGSCGASRPTRSGSSARWQRGQDPGSEGAAAALFRSVIDLAGQLGMRPLVAHGHLGLGRLSTGTRVEHLGRPPGCSERWTCRTGGTTRSARWRPPI